MTETHYDIDAVKKYFFYYTYRKQTSRLTEEEYRKYTTRPYFLLSEKIGGILINSFMGILFLLLGFEIYSFGALGSPFLTFDNLAPFITFLPFLCFWGYMTFIGTMMYKRSTRLGALNKYFDLKEKNEILEDEFEKAINKDANDPGINPIEVERIEKILSNLGKTTKIILGPLIEFRKLKNELKEEQRGVMEQFINIESDWLIKYIEKFQALLRRWINIHEKELEDQKDSLKQSNIKAYNLAIGHLETEKVSLEKVKLSL